MTDFSRPYIGNPNLRRQGLLARIGQREDVFSGPAVAFMSGLLGTAPDEQSGSVLDPAAARNSPNAANAGFALGTITQLSPLSKVLILLKNAAPSALGFASRNVRIRNPQPLPQRPFSDDYKAASSAGPIGQRLEVDIDGRPLSARYIAGRRMVGEADRAVNQSEIDDITSLLGIKSTRVPARQIAGNVGRYSNDVLPSGEVAKHIRIDEGLAPDTAAMVQSHELGHAVNDMAGIYNPATKYGEIPSQGLSKELSNLYDTLNNRLGPGDPLMPRISKRQHTPQFDGYAEMDWSPERWAEAIRVYMRDPNFIKTVAPKTAARIREYVNANQNLNKVIQFNSAAGTGLLGSLYGQDREQ